MRKYETMYIIRPDLAEEKYPQVMEKYAALIQNNGGEIVKTDIWGRRRLAYEIAKLQEGYYVVVKFLADAAFPAELERNFRISDDIIRYLVVNEE